MSDNHQQESFFFVCIEFIVEFELGCETVIERGSSF